MDEAFAIAWGITGAGAYIEDSVDVIGKLILTRGIPVTVFVSRAGKTVLKAYGLLDKLESMIKGDYPTGVIYEDNEQPGFPVTGRMYKGVYGMVVIAPSTMNTVSKIVNGIADTLVTCLAMHAIKTGTPLYILPVDAFETKSKIPLVIERKKCAQCLKCIVAEICPTGALKPSHMYKVEVNPVLCTRCYKCLYACPQDAVKFDVEITVRPHKHYLSIINKLRDIEGVNIIDHPARILEMV
ncbi:MAG: flavoprotein [Desulfurococcaceae archaeon]